MNGPPHIPPVNAAAVKKAAAGAGFDLCGIAPYRTLEDHGERLARWLADRRHGNLAYMERDPAKRCDPWEVFPGAKSVVVCAVNYRNRAWDLPDDGRPKIASYALARDYHHTVKAMLRQMLDTLRKDYPDLRGRAVTDTAPLLEKAWAVEAGLGKIGKQSLLITRQYGSAVILGELLLDAEMDRYDTPSGSDACGECRRCMDACPTGAVRGDRTIDAGLCISRLTIEPGADLPQDGADLAGWAFGCDECQKQCPINRDKPLLQNPLFTPVADPGDLTTERWGNMTSEEFKGLFTGTPLERPGLDEIYCRIRAMVKEP